jgi:hypothetical protein
LISISNQAWWCIPVILAALRKLRQYCKFEANLGYVEDLLKKPKQSNNNNNNKILNLNDGRRHISPYTKTNQKWITDLNVRAKIIKFIEGNM